MQRVDEFILQDVGGEAILVPIGQKVVDLNGLIALNATGLFLWEQLAQPREVGELADLLCGEFEVEPAVARTDVLAFTQRLREIGAVIE